MHSVGASLKDVINSTIYIPNVADAPTVMAYVGERFRGIDPARTVLCTPLGNDEFKVEIEVQAYKGSWRCRSEADRHQPVIFRLEGRRKPASQMNETFHPSDFSHSK